METSVLVSLVKELGLGVGVFGLCCWLTVFIVKRLAASIDKLVSHIEISSQRVRMEHEQSSKQHEKMMEEHGEMIKTLGRINGYRRD